jgi:hypothetical protein
VNFLLDDTGDLAFENNNWVMADGVDEIKQICKCNLQSVAGEWFLDTTQGLPYFEEIFEKQSDVQRVNSIFINELKKVPGIISIIRFETTLDSVTRELTVNFEARTASGILTFNEQLVPTGDVSENQISGA